MSDNDLNKKLDIYQAPEVSALLKARILKAAKTMPANEAMEKRSFTRRFMPIAASLLAVCAIGLTTLQLSQTDETETAAWQEAAADLGFDDIYEWVESEELSTTES